MELLTGRGEEKENAPNQKAGVVDLWIKVWEELYRLAARDVVVEVEHVKAYRTKKDKKDMSRFERFVTEGNEKADEMAKAGAMRRIYGGNESNDNAARKRRGVCSCAVRSQLFTVWWRERL